MRILHSNMSINYFKLNAIHENKIKSKGGPNPTSKNLRFWKHIGI